MNNVLASINDQNIRPMILLVDDEPEILLALTDLLEDEFEILAVGNPLQALEILKEMPAVSVIVSDQRMPDMNGDQFLTQARNFTSAPAILLTGYADMEAVIAALNQGRIMFYSHKPWEEGALLSMIRQAVGHFQMEKELRIERLLLQGMLDNVPEGLAFKDDRGRFIRINEQAASSFGLTVAECIGCTEEECQKKSRSQTARHITYRIEGDERVEEMVELSDQSCAKTLKWLHIIRVSLSAILENHSFSVMVEHDMTEFRKLEAQLQQAEKMLALGTMAGGIAHDFNNILTSMIGSLELLQQFSCIQDEQGLLLLSNAFSAAQKGRNLTQRLLSFSRQQEVKFQHVNISEALQHMQALLEQAVHKRAEDKRQKNADANTVVFHYPNGKVLENPYWAYTDPEQLEMTIMNLCLNAVDAMPQGGNITVSIGSREILSREREQELLAGHYVVVTVSDTGTGMSDEVKAHIFEPFFTTKREGAGTGLGLAIVYAFLKKQGGGITIDSRIGEGSSFSIYLPVDQRMRF